MTKQPENGTGDSAIRQRRETKIMLLLVGMIPFVWYFFTTNHSYIHPRLVYRSLGVTVFAWMSAFVLLLWGDFFSDTMLFLPTSCVILAEVKVHEYTKVCMMRMNQTEVEWR